MGEIIPIMPTGIQIPEIISLAGHIRNIINGIIPANVGIKLITTKRLLDMGS